MKLCVIFVVIAFFSPAADGATFSLGNCARMDVSGSVTLTATKDETTFTHELDLTSPSFNISGSCGEENATALTMTVNFANSLDWILVFAVRDDDRVQLDQTMRFSPSALFDNTTLPEGSQSVAATQGLPLSLRNHSFLCNAEQNIPFSSQEADNYTFAVSMVITNFHVQAFEMENDNFSPAEECTEDQTTPGGSTDTTEPGQTTTPPPQSTPLFRLVGDNNVTCFLLQANLQVVVEYNTTKNTMELSNPIPFPQSSVVGGTCSDASPVMTLSNAQNCILSIEEKKDGDAAHSIIELTVQGLAPDAFPNAADVNATLKFEMGAESFPQNKLDTFYNCEKEQELHFKDSRTTLRASNVKLQAFGLNDGNFTGDGVDCNLNPTTAPPATTPAPAEENTYAVNNTFNNATCIVFTGDISFTNISYTKNDNTSATVGPIGIPKMNETTQNVNFTGNCDLDGGDTQQLVITFNGDWSLTLTFVRGAQQAELGAESDEYSVRDIDFVYTLSPEFFPNASNPNERVVASQHNITGDFMKGSVDGGSFKCDAELTRTLNNGVQMETTNLQYKAFNDDLNQNFNAEVNECSADNDTNSIVPIAVGAALGGLVVIVIIAYLIARRRSSHKGYDSM